MTAQSSKAPVRRPDAGALTRAQRWGRRAPLLPALLFVIALTQVPFLFTVYYSTQGRNLLRPDSGEFVGLANYAKVLAEPHFRNAVANTVVLTVSAVALSMLLGIALAVLLDQRFAGRAVVRTMLITPFLVMPAAAALLWKTSMYHPVFGLVNWALSPFGISADWVSQYPLLSIIAVLTWQWTPFMMLIVLAGLQSQSPEVLEAARVDGAGSWATFRRVTFPHLRRFIELGILLGTIYVVQTFDAIFMITQGGPGQASTNLPYFIYLQAFRAFDVGEAAAAGVIVVAATIAIAMFALRVISNLFEEES
ncbi:sorbitol/mannitol transport system permease protein [Nocardiopsis mwathae]|uniref:Sorbitol/mannitol transport system permease protein n=1 Tax=Nocardiopsis mwathae TaxID=1472723 RepID=A0A7W9YFR4_9ACTN|nr:sugar ABC transporter permease [Nocardiopsis mwathae]MBB6171338.1 sorbitol/mannitol transport system permease protein [Nocardiopsis mwathae]